MMKKYIGILQHPGYNGGFADDVLGFDDNGGIAGSIGNIADDVLGLDPNGGGIYDVPIIGDIADTLINSDLGAVVGLVVPPVAVARAAQSLATAHQTGKGALAAVAQAALAAYGMSNTVQVAGIPMNANVVAATEMALAEGYTATEVAKTLVGFGDPTAIEKTLVDAGYKTAEAAAASSVAAEINAKYTLTGTEALTAGDLAGVTEGFQLAGFSEAETLGQLQSLGVSSDVASYLSGTYYGTLAAPVTEGVWEAVNNPDATGMQGFEKLNNPSITKLEYMQGGLGDELYDAYQTAWEKAADPSYRLSNQMAADLNAAGMPLPPEYGYGDAYMPTGIGSSPVVLQKLDPQVPLNMQELPPLQLEEKWFANMGLPSSAATDPLNYLNSEGLGVGPDYFGINQADMLAAQYAGFDQADIVAHMAGSGIDPVLAEDVLGQLGMDQFAISDYMKANPTSFGNTYADPSFFGKLKSAASSAKSILGDVKGIIGSSGSSSGGGMGGATSNATSNYEMLANLIDPYRGYRLNTEIPMMGAAAGAVGALSGLYQQSFTDPLAAYQTPEMQALNAQFMNQTQRRDAAAGRMSQYGARGVEAQNQYLTSALPEYRKNLQQGLGTLYTAAKPQAYNMEVGYSAAQDAIEAAKKATSANPATGLAGTISGLQGSWNQMTNNDNVLGQIEGAVNLASGLSDLYTQGSNAWNKISSWF